MQAVFQTKQSKQNPEKAQKIYPKNCYLPSGTKSCGIPNLFSARSNASCRLSFALPFLMILIRSGPTICVSAAWMRLNIALESRKLAPKLPITPVSLNGRSFEYSL